MFKSSKQNEDELSQLGYTRGKQVKENSIFKCEGGLRDKVTDTNWTVDVVAVSTVIFTGLPNGHDFNSVKKAPKYFALN